MKIDSHHHFWNYSPEDYGWIGEGMDVLKRDFGPDDLRPVLDEAGIDGVVSVQAQTVLAENDDLTGHAAAHDWIRGVVGWIDLTADDAAGQVARFAQQPKAVGVREVLQGLDDDAYCLREDFNRGVAALHEFGLVYDMLVFPRHLGPVLAFVDRHPAQRFVLDHLAKPAIGDTAPDPAWVKGIRALAERENVACKVSGMVTEVKTGLEPSRDRLRPFYDVVLDAFGADRLLFGSDWPVCLLRSGYLGWKETVWEWTEELSAGERAAIRGENAVRVYGLED